MNLKCVLGSKLLPAKIWQARIWQEPNAILQGKPKNVYFNRVFFLKKCSWNRLCQKVTRIFRKARLVIYIQLGILPKATSRTLAYCWKRKKKVFFTLDKKNVENGPKKEEFCVIYTVDETDVSTKTQRCRFLFIFDENHRFMKILISLVKWLLQFFPKSSKHCWYFTNNSYVLLCKKKTIYAKFHPLQCQKKRIRGGRFLVKNMKFWTKYEPKMRFSHETANPSFHHWKNRIYPGRIDGQFVG